MLLLVGCARRTPACVTQLKRTDSYMFRTTHLTAMKKTNASETRPTWYTKQNYARGSTTQCPSSCCNIALQRSTTRAPAALAHAMERTERVHAGRELLRGRWRQPQRSRGERGRGKQGSLRSHSPFAGAGFRTGYHRVHEPVHASENHRHLLRHGDKLVARRREGGKAGACQSAKAIHDTE